MPGDDLKRIHWKASAKYDTLLVKNYEKIEGNEVFLGLGPERLLIAEADGTIMGTAALLDLKMTLEGRSCPFDGVAAVAVDTVARRRGVADALMGEAILSAHQRKVPVSMLYAFRASFYRRFGYAPVEMAQVVHADLQQARFEGAADDSVAENFAEHRRENRNDINAH